jgi:ATP-dependent Lon protease
MKKGDIIFDEQLLKHIIELYAGEEGVRNLKRALNNIISWINMIKYIPTDNIDVKFPFNVSTDLYNKYLKKNDNQTNAKFLSMYI